MKIKLTKVDVAWFSGWMGSFAYRSLYQDYMGKSEYLEYAAQHWTDPSISVPIAIVVGLLALGGYMYANDGNEEKPDVQL